MSSATDLTETLISSDKLLSGNFLHVKKDTVRLPNGRSAT
ncbi:MAG: ADP-ribose pyrophosphatase, partial [Brachymonas sp.]